MPIQATAFLRPNGRREEITVANISDDDAYFFNTRGIKVSLEEDSLGGQVVYADYGALDEDGQPEEIIVFSRGRSCEDTMAELRELTEKAMTAFSQRGI